MLSIPEKLKGISHPLVSSMYLKKDYSKDAASENVLVIETNYNEDADEYQDFDSYLMKLLSDLNDLQMQAEKNIGKFDRIDIRH